MRITSLRAGLAVAIPALSLLALAGCSGADPDQPVNPGSSSTEATHAEQPTEPPPSSRPASTTNTHGNLVKHVGDDAGITIDGKPAADWVVTKIAVDPPCRNRYAEKPANGHFVVLTMRVTTTPQLLNDDGSPGSVTFSEGIWSGYDSHGTKFNDVLGNAYSCLADSERLPDQIGPGQTATGKLAFDVTSATGSLELPQLVAPGGWEYAYPG
jgi:hypothetical protein